MTDSEDKSTAGPGGVRLLGPGEIRSLAAELGITPTKKLGQNFVLDPNTVRRIVSAAELGPGDHVIEVGPGLGSLTLALLDRVGDVTAVEIDRRLADRLPRTVSEHASHRETDVTVLSADALTLTAPDLDRAGVHPPTALVANLPYNVSVPVLLHLLSEFPSIRRVLVMVQAEVAERLAAAPGSKIYGVPSVKAGFHGAVTRAGTVGRNVFWPAPKIDSGLVRIDRWTDGDRPWQNVLTTLSPPDRQALQGEVFALTDAAFLQRRKTLRAALAGYFGSPQSAEEVLTAAGIDPRQRGEKLGTVDFVTLAVASLAARSGGDGDTPATLRDRQ
ncbi:MAG: 16S rRNA (adenine(1518)-N(6)/adenine(1519)-N(6))-dimethyltransferase RsmA [Corynebacterium provencense]|uniref:16S rRNA (adenine(1518)-N(6)/adenine(1519)-N(6))- dimethyltransferase RsmA n=1 Tax=Corynebacterium provencense TaxID=1737425 RepID=UPI002989B3CE|nr:16S rRNA (adenine(1518)-N(6)/adenine(1519)-N(6))-dimethyltransferase RsmA [Corynebacterium provencense]